MNNQGKQLSELSRKLQVLKPTEKNKYLYELDTCLKDVQLHGKSNDVFFPYRWAQQVYASLEGKPYTQPTFTHQTISKDMKTTEKFESLFVGVLTYLGSTDEQREDFKKSVLKPASSIGKAAHLYKMYRNKLI